MATFTFRGATMQRVLASLLLATVACGSDSSGPTTSTLQNDDFTSGGSSATFVAGFGTGEAAAARLGPKTAAFTIHRVEFFFGGSSTPHTVTLTIYQDGDSVNPGTPIYSHDYPLTPSDASFQAIDLTGQDLHVAANQKIRVAITFSHNGLPSVARDGALTPARNLLFLNPGGWVTAESVGVPGDFIIRTEISTP
jgi:hypothetical protein